MMRCDTDYMYLYFLTTLIGHYQLDRLRCTSAECHHFVDLSDMDSVPAIMLPIVVSANILE